MASRSIPVLDIVHDGRHKLENRPLERESIPYVIPIPDLNMAAFVYTWITNEGKAGAIFVAYGDGIGTNPIVEKVDDIDMPASADFDDWNVGMLHLRQDLKLKTAHIRVNSERVKFDCVFEAFHPAYAYGSHEQGCPSYAATNRLEQAGRVVGSLEIDGFRRDFSTMGARDHSWGTRDWTAPQHWKWLHAQAGTDLCIHFWQINVEGRTDLRGYVWRDEVLAEVTHVNTNIRLDEKGRQRWIEATVLDSSGRESNVTGDFYGHFPMLPVPEITLVESAMRCLIDGQPAVGWSEFMWPSTYLESMVATRALKTG